MKNNKELECCVFYFFNENELQMKKQKTHKVVKSDFFIQNEIRNHKRLSKSNNKQHFYLCNNDNLFLYTNHNSNLFMPIKLRPSIDCY